MASAFPRLARVALISHSTRDKNHILPLVCKRCSEGKIEGLAWSLPQIQRIDASKDFHRGCSELLRLWGIVYEPYRHESPRSYS